MNYLDVYYRALIDYRRNTLQDKVCEGQRSATVKANANADNVTITRKICQVDIEWVETIEKGLEHVEKAIREDRQFIRSNGEVVDIEKVKSVSKDSVKHLAQHSNLITRYTEGEDIVPDRLYIVERLNDYAVYENRFLYMMLCYLRDFITVRYNEILELEHTYNAGMSMHKKVDLPKRQISLDIEFKETKSNDPYLADRSPSKAVIDRIRDILELVHAFLATPLMEEVSKVAMIKPPVTKTNVLRMNQNFRGAMALYEYVAAYDKPGYTVIDDVQTIQPFRFDMADEFAEIVLLSSFLTYEYGMNVKADLQANYEAEEERLRQEKELRHLEQLKALRRRVRESGDSIEEYMLMLEKRNRRLEADSEQLVLAQESIEKLQGAIEQLNAEAEARADVIDQLNEDIVNMQAAHAKQLEEERFVWQSEMQEAKEAHEKAMLELAEEHRAATDLAAHQHAVQIADLNQSWRAQADALRADCTQREHMLQEANSEKERLLAARRLAEARLQAMRAEQGMPNVDMTSREAFEEMEHQFKVFKSLFETEWKKTKRHIRKSAFDAYRQAIKEGRDKEYLSELAGKEADAAANADAHAVQEEEPYSVKGNEEA